jgi:hypothetical protein
MLTSRFAVVVSVVSMCTFMFAMGMGVALACETEWDAWDACEATCEFGCGDAGCLFVHGTKGQNPWTGRCDAKSCEKITNPFEINCVYG